MFSKRAQKNWSLIITDTRGCKEPAADQVWYVPNMNRTADRRNTGQAAVDGEADVAEQAHANLHKSCMES